MQMLWYFLVSVMLAVYVVLDGFDFGAGILHLFVAKTDEDRRTVLAAIGPVWDGNEVWLLASGGVLVFSFPRAYAAGFSGFYLPLMMVLWLLILRGVSIEFRSKEPNSLWRSFWDGMFVFSSGLMAIFLGAALGNVIRGVPLTPEGFFRGPLFTNFLPGRDPGVLDWYTVLVAVFTLAVLAGHGALFLAWKTNGPVHDRAKAASAPIWVAVVVLLILATVATAQVRPQLYAAIGARPWTWPLAIGAQVALVGVFFTQLRGKELGAFLASAAFIALLLAATAAGMWPYLLISTHEAANSLTAYNSATGATGLKVGIIWWSLAMILAIGYFAYLFRSFRGKVALDQHSHGY